MWDCSGFIKLILELTKTILGSAEADVLSVRRLFSLLVLLLSTLHIPLPLLGARLLTFTFINKKKKV